MSSYQYFKNSLSRKKSNRKASPQRRERSEDKILKKQSVTPDNVLKELDINSFNSSEKRHKNSFEREVPNKANEINENIFMSNQSFNSSEKAKKEDLRRLRNVKIPSNLNLKEEMLPCLLDVQNVLNCLSETKNSMKELKLDKANLKMEVKKLTRENEKLKGELATSERRGFTLETSYSQLKEDHKKLSQQIESLKNELSNSIKPHQFEEFKAKYISQNKENKDLKEKVKTLQVDIVVLQKIMHEMATENDTSYSQEADENDRSRQNTHDSLKYSQDKENSYSGGGFYQSFGNSENILSFNL